jgi:hypothetical protein
VNEQPLKGLQMHGKALAGVASSITMIITRLRRIIPVTRDNVSTTMAAAHRPNRPRKGAKGVNCLTCWGGWLGS